MHAWHGLLFTYGQVVTRHLPSAPLGVSHQHQPVTRLGSKTRTLSEQNRPRGRRRLLRHSPRLTPGVSVTLGGRRCARVTRGCRRAHSPFPSPGVTRIPWRPHIPDTPARGPPTSCELTWTATDGHVAWDPPCAMVPCSTDAWACRARLPDGDAWPPRRP